VPGVRRSGEVYPRLVGETGGDEPRPYGVELRGRSWFLFVKFLAENSWCICEGDLTSYGCSRKIIKNLLRLVLLFLGLGSVKMTESLVAWRVTKEVSAKVNSYRKGRLCLGGWLKNVVAQFNGTGKWPWCLVNQATARIHFVARGFIPRGRDPRQPVSSFYFGDGRGSVTRFAFLPGLSRGRGNGRGEDGTDERDHYRGPWSTLRREGAGRSWATSDTSNICGVERK